MSDAALVMNTRTVDYLRDYPQYKELFTAITERAAEVIGVDPASGGNHIVKFRYLGTKGLMSVNTANKPLQNIKRKLGGSYQAAGRITQNMPSKKQNRRPHYAAASTSKRSGAEVSPI